MLNITDWREWKVIIGNILSIYKVRPVYAIFDIIVLKINEKLFKTV